MKKVVINPAYQHLRKYVESIPENFDSLGKLLEARRNVIREDQVEGLTIVIKSFKRIYLTNRVRYSFFYPSKAQRAFDNANLLVQNGFNTPAPVAYIEDKPNGILKESFFVSEYIDLKPLEGIFRPFEKGVVVPVETTADLILQLAHYTFNLHHKNIFHADFTLGNILYKKTSDRYEFALVDNNRMKFGPVSYETGIRNLVRLLLPPAQLEEITKEYARLWNEDGAEAYERLLSFREKEARKNIFKASLKKMAVTLKLKPAPKQQSH
ncbi:MAG TPA: lipopolysaccharide kinase InaA family protein [Cyclobacteriaceae bacterium]